MDACFTPPEGYWQRVREICDRYNVLLISDEVICAWGRLGEWFGAQKYDYVPDIITTAKGLLELGDWEVATGCEQECQQVQHEATDGLRTRFARGPCARRSSERPRCTNNRQADAAADAARARPLTRARAAAAPMYARAR